MTFYPANKNANDLSHFNIHKQDKLLFFYHLNLNVALIFGYLDIYEHFKVHAQLSWA